MLSFLLVVFRFLLNLEFQLVFIHENQQLKTKTFPGAGNPDFYLICFLRHYLLNMKQKGNIITQYRLKLEWSYKRVVVSPGAENCSLLVLEFPLLCNCNALPDKLIITYPGAPEKRHGLSASDGQIVRQYYFCPYLHVYDLPLDLMK